MSPIIRLLLCSFLAALTTTSYAEVFISSIISTEEKLVHYDVGPRQYVTIPLPNSNTEGDSYILKIVATNKVYKDISAYLVDQTNLELFQKGQTYRGLGHSRTKTPITITGTTNTQGKKYLILDNTYAGFITKKMDVYITASLPIDERKSEAMKASFTHLYDELKRDFIFTNFNIHIEPCGQVNAYSESVVVK
jgi:hypothetical protein